MVSHRALTATNLRPPRAGEFSAFKVTHYPVFPSLVPSPAVWYHKGMSTLDGSSLHRFLVQFTDTFTPELADHFANLPASPELQARLDELGDKANDGTLTADERTEYATYVETMDVIALLRVKSLPGDGPEPTDS